MTNQEYDALAQLLIEKAADIEQAKRPAYTIGSEDCLANFKRSAERTGISPGQSLANHMLKHVDAVITALCRPDLPQAEEIAGRFADLINYTKLGYAMVVERGRSGPHCRSSNRRRRPGVRRRPSDDRRGERGKEEEK